MHDRSGEPSSFKSTRGGVAAVDRALCVLTAVENADTPLSLSELSRVTGFYKSTLLRLLASLESSALVVQRPDLCYELGPLAFRLGRAYDSNNQLEEKVLSALKKLVEQNTQSSSFHMRYNNSKRLCLFRVDSNHSTLDNVKTGDLLPLSAGAAAKVICYFHPSYGHTITPSSPIIFRSLGERDPSCAGIAAPVFASYDLFIGAISLSGPRNFFHEANVRWMSDLLIHEAYILTKSLGGNWWWDRK